MSVLDVEAFEKDGATSISALTLYRNAQWNHELNGDGSGSIEIPLDGAEVIASPDILTGGNIVKFTLPGESSAFFGFVVESIAPVLTAAGEKADRWVTLSGRGPRCVLQKTIIFPENQGIGALYSLRDTFSENRPTDFSSYIGSWKVLADWNAPLGQAQGTDTTGVRGGSGGDYPTSWPDPTAEWIWVTDPTATATVEVNYFRADFNLGSAETVALWASGDNRLLSVRIDGEEVAADDLHELYGWKKTYQTTAIALDAGNHTVAALVENRSGPGGFLCTVGTLDASGNLDTVLLRTNTTDWEVHDSSNTPGWLHGHILVKFVQESQARSEIPDVTLSFTTTDDSASDPWTQRINRVWRVGTDLLDALDQLIELGCDADMSPELVLSAWLRKGQDLTASVILADGVNITAQAPTGGYGALRNSVLLRYKNGWVLVEDAGSIAAIGRQAISLSAGDAESLDEATAIADAYLAEATQEQIVLSVELQTPAAAVPTPELDFTVGDTITAPGFLGTPLDARVMAIGGATSDNTINWHIDLYPEA